MKAVLLGVILAMTCALAHAEDMAEMISQYRRAHGLSAVKTDPQLTAIAERQAKAMAASGVMDHDVAGSFSSRMSGARTGGVAAENIAAGTGSWAETLSKWKASPGHNANLLQSKADIGGRRRPQRSDPLQDLLGHGDRGEAIAEKEGAQGRRRTKNCGAPRECRQLRKSDQHDQEFRLQVSLLNCSRVPTAPEIKTFVPDA
jgi:cysteine-rich secretory family protein